MLGGDAGAYDEEAAPWLPLTRSLLVQAVEVGVPTSGGCLGAQLLAVACGGRVEAGASGTEASLVDVHSRWAARTNALFHDLVVRRAPSVHEDAGRRAPAGTSWLGEAALCRDRTFREGERVGGVQFHAKGALPALPAWADHHDGEWASRGLDGDEVVEPLRRYDRELAEFGELLAQRCSGQVDEWATRQASGT